MNKNTSVSLWSFIFVIAISLMYVNKYAWPLEENLRFNGGYVMSFFMFLFGYYIVKYYKDNHSKSKKSASSKAWNFISNLIKVGYPLYLVGVLIAFIVRNIINGTHISSILPSFMDSIWEFLGLSSLGAVGLNSFAGISFDNVLGFSHLWNEPLWIFSTFTVVGFVMYYIFSKNEDVFKGLVVPLMVIITYGSLGLGGFTNVDLTFLGIYFGLLRVATCVGIGMVSYYLVEYLKKKKFSEVEMLSVSLVHIGCVVFFLYTIFAGFSWSHITHELFCLLFMIVLLINNDYIAVLYNKSKICEFLGNISIYYYVIFIVWIYAIRCIFPELSYGFSIIFNIFFSFGSAYIMYLVHKYLKKD